MEFNVRIAILQLVDNKQVYEEIPPALSTHPIKIKISILVQSIET
jgi:hypothetical protein